MYFRRTIHSGCLESLKPAYFASASLCLLPTTISALLKEKQSLIHPRFSSSAVTELETGLGSCTVAPRMTSRTFPFFLLLHPPKAFSPQEQAPKNHRDSLQSSADSGMGSSRDRTGGRFAVSHP